MKIEARFRSKTPQIVDDAERLQIKHGVLEIEISHAGDGLYIRLDAPLGDSLMMFPVASNSIVLVGRQEKFR